MEPRIPPSSVNRHIQSSSLQPTPSSSGSTAKLPEEPEITGSMPPHQPVPVPPNPDKSSTIYAQRLLKATIESNPVLKHLLPDDQELANPVIAKLFVLEHEGLISSEERDYFLNQILRVISVNDEVEQSVLLHEMLDSKSEFYKLMKLKIKGGDEVQDTKSNKPSYHFQVFQKSLYKLAFSKLNPSKMNVSELLLVMENCYANAKRRGNSDLAKYIETQLRSNKVMIGRDSKTQGIGIYEIFEGKKCYNLAEILQLTQDLSKGINTGTSHGVKYLIPIITPMLEERFRTMTAILASPETESKGSRPPVASPDVLLPMMMEDLTTDLKAVEINTKGPDTAGSREKFDFAKDVETYYEHIMADSVTMISQKASEEEQNRSLGFFLGRFIKRSASGENEFKDTLENRRVLDRFKTYVTDRLRSEVPDNERSTLERLQEIFERLNKGDIGEIPKWVESLSAPTGEQPVASSVLDRDGRRSAVVTPSVQPAMHRRIQSQELRSS